jgi:hypothetical protein
MEDAPPMIDSKIRDTYLENWYDRLQGLTIPSIGQEISIGQARALACSLIELGECHEQPSPSEFSELKAAFAALWAKAKSPPYFCRLGSRSPKDAYGLQNKATSLKEMIGCFTSCSERLSDDLSLAYCNDYRPWLWLRKWVFIEPELEWRYFIINGEIQGLSQYHYLKSEKIYPPVQSVTHSADEIQKWWETKAKPIWPSNLLTAVVDVYLDLGSGQVILIEINPYFEMTDPCLFTWKELLTNMPRQIRWLQATVRTRSKSLEKE